MAGNATRRDVKTPPAIISYAHNLFELRKSDEGKESYGATLLFPKTADISAMQNEALAAAVETWGDKAAQWIKDGVIRSPFLDGDGPQALAKKTGERHKGYAGHWFMRCTSGPSYRPKVFNRKKLEVLDKTELTSGSLVFAVVNPFTWDNPKNGKGITFGISLVQIIKPAVGDEILGGGGGGPDPDKWLEKLDADAPAPKGDAANLFGG